MPLTSVYCPHCGLAIWAERCQGHCTYCTWKVCPGCNRLYDPDQAEPCRP